MPPEIKHPPCADVSHWKHPITFAALNPLPWLLFTKATEGDNPLYDDAYLVPWFAFMKLYGIRRGAFHFLRPGDVGNQADRFIRQIRKTEWGKDDIPVLDWEDTGNSLADAKQWLEHVERVLGQRPIIYSSAQIVERLYMNQPTPGWFLNYYWWVAGYPNTPDTFSEIPLYYIPRGVPRDKVCAWQYTDAGRWSGITGNVDLNLLSPWWIKELGLLAPKGYNMTKAFSITPLFTDGVSVRPSHATNNTPITKLPYNTFAFGSTATPWIATASDAYHMVGDRWWEVDTINGNPILVNGQPVKAWIAETHMGKPVSKVDLLDDTTQPPPAPVDDLVFTLSLAAPGHQSKSVTIILPPQ